MVHQVKSIIANTNSKTQLDCIVCNDRWVILIF